MKCPAISDKLYNAMWGHLTPDDFDLSNKVDAKLAEYLGKLPYEDEEDEELDLVISDLGRGDISLHFVEPELFEELLWKEGEKSSEHVSGEDVQHKDTDTKNNQIKGEITN